MCVTRAPLLHAEFDTLACLWPLADASGSSDDAADAAFSAAPLFITAEHGAESFGMCNHPPHLQ